jgi:hypothetical protein
MKRWVTIIRSQGNYFRRSLSLIFSLTSLGQEAAPAATDAAATVATAVLLLQQVEML